MEGGAALAFTLTPLLPPSPTRLPCEPIGPGDPLPWAGASSDAECLDVKRTVRALPIGFVYLFACARRGIGFVYSLWRCPPSSPPLLPRPNLLACSSGFPSSSSLLFLLVLARSFSSSHALAARRIFRRSWPGDLEEPTRRRSWPQRGGRPSRQSLTTRS